MRRDREEKEASGGGIGKGGAEWSTRVRGGEDMADGEMNPSPHTHTLQSRGK